MALLEAHEFDLFADYYQFYVQDEAVDTDWSSAWTEAATARMLATVPGVVAVGTAKNNHVPVLLEFHNAEPSADEEKWDRVNECDLAVESGSIVVAGCTDHFPDAARIAVAPGAYTVRISYSLGASDHYRLQLWK